MVIMCGRVHYKWYSQLATFPFSDTIMESIKDRLTVSLPPELAGIAASELNETPANRRQSLKEFHKSLEDEGKEEDEFLLRFLRCKKFNVSRALSVYEGYHTFRRDNPHLFENLCPHGVRHIWEAGVIGALPHRDKKGRAIMVAFPGRWDPDRHSLEDMMRAMILQLEHLITSVETQINGIVMIADFSEFSFYQARCIRPWYFQLLASLVQVGRDNITYQKCHHK